MGTWADRWNPLRGPRRQPGSKVVQPCFGSWERPAVRLRDAYADHVRCPPLGERSGLPLVLPQVLLLMALLLLLLMLQMWCG